MIYLLYFLAVERSASWWFQPTHLKTMLVKLDHFRKDRGEFSFKKMKPPPRKGFEETKKRKNAVISPPFNLKL